MKGLAVAIALLLLGSVAQAQDISGTWQGTMQDRRVFKVTKAAGGYHAEMYLAHDIGGTVNGNPISHVTVTKGDVRFETDRKYGIFEGKLSADGNTITGSWTNTAGSQPLVLTRATKATAWKLDSSPHKTMMVEAAPGVKIEVLDWGGTGTPLIFLAGQGNTAHVFDDFARRFTASHHVYGFTRRGFGISSWPAPTEANYNADRLGDDVVAVMDKFHIQKAILAGHSIAGQELSSVGTRYAERVSGLVYLDSGAGYALYDPNAPTLGANWGIDSDMAAVRRDLAAMPNASIAEEQALVKDLQESLPRIVQGLPQYEFDQPAKLYPQTLVINAMLAGRRKYRGTDLPVLAFFSVPHDCGKTCDDPREKAWMAAEVAQADAFERDNAHARVIRWPHEQHYMFRSRADDTYKEMTAFMDALPKP
jgi:non-heme chloroperoxidase